MAFKRAVSVHRNWITEGGEFPVEAGRYHLYVSYACPWAHRCLIVRRLSGLEDVVSVSVVHPTFQRTRPNDASDDHYGWTFLGKDAVTNPLGYGNIPDDGATVDHVLGKRNLRDIYEHTGSDTKRYSVPLLFDKGAQRIVSNESADIIAMLPRLRPFAKGADPVDLFPADKAAEMQEVDDRVYSGLNNGVYRTGFAQTQDAYNEAVALLCDTLDWLEARLEKSRYLTGSSFTASDVRAFVTLVRFDPVYAVYFKCSKKLLREYPNVFAYIRDLYSHPAFGSTTNMDHITRHYYTSHAELNKYAIIPVCSTDLTLPHDRDTRSYSE